MAEVLCGFRVAKFAYEDQVKLYIFSPFCKLQPRLIPSLCFSSLERRGGPEEALRVLGHAAGAQDERGHRGRGERVHPGKWENKKI